MGPIYAEKATFFTIKIDFPNVRYKPVRRFLLACVKSGKLGLNYGESLEIKFDQVFLVFS